MRAQGGAPIVGSEETEDVERPLPTGNWGYTDCVTASGELRGEGVVVGAGVAKAGENEHGETGGWGWGGGV